uniref:T-complex protein 1 subunit alpha-like n=1 Tax=Dermatophagoides pteronyssinus TaxID=6956 RepID=A0A6P6YIS3_DERPT|nr:T-complex protein 1 subunit alpha-like [Dermatophagoides pteronyssinus]
MALTKILSTSLGPNGLDKMLVNKVGDVTVTNDGATILKKLDVKHPAAKVLVDLSILQDDEVGDGTTSVVLIAAELFRKAQTLIERGFHPGFVVRGIKAAGKEAYRFIQKNLSTVLTESDEEVLRNIVRTSLVSKIANAETDIAKKRAMAIVNSGANVLLSSEGIDDLSEKYFLQHNLFVVRRVPKEDLFKLAKATGGKVLCSVSDFDTEAIAASELGTAEKVYEERIAEWNFIFVSGTRAQAATTVFLRGANLCLLSELERCVHDALCALSRALESGSVTAGGGATETALALFFKERCLELEPELCATYQEFGEALLVIPRCICVNAALDATAVVAKLVATHAQSFADAAYAHRSFGVDIDSGDVRDNLRAGVVEPTQIKLKAIRFATETAITLLRIDDVIRCAPKPQPAGQPTAG